MRSVSGNRAVAFTLVELLISISVIGFLMSMLLPSLKAAREQAKVAACKSNLFHIGRAGAGYSSENRDWLCGSPGTSGSVLYPESEPAPASDELEMAGDPAQNWDFAGPLSARQMASPFNGNRAERLRQAGEGRFRCASNAFEAEPFPGGAPAAFERQWMTSYNTFRGFMMWSRTMVDWNPAEPWGVRAPVLEASFDTVGGRTLTPKRYRPNINRVAAPGGKVYMADGNRFTDEHGVTTYDIAWDAENGGAFCNGGPTLAEEGAGPPGSGLRFLLSSYHFDPQRGKKGYRHMMKGERGIVVNFFDGHCEFMTETRSRHPRYFWPKGTTIPFPEMNEGSQQSISTAMLDSSFSYVVGH